MRDGAKKIKGENKIRKSRSQEQFKRQLKNYRPTRQGESCRRDYGINLTARRMFPHATTIGETVGGNFRLVFK